MREYRVSIVIPVYRTERFLEPCVQSALEQTCPEIEIILVDDGSPDHCPEICDKYAAQYEQIRVIHQQNQGRGFARNAGLLAARGKYIFYMDSDDLLDGKDAILALYQRAEEKQADITVGNYRKFHDLEILDINRHHLQDGEFTKTGAFCFDGFYRYGHLAYNWAKLYRRAFLMDNHILSGAYPFTQDKANNMLCYACRPVYAFVDESVYLYRINEESVTFQYKENLIPVWISIAKDFQEEVKNRGISGDFYDVTDFHIFFGSFFLVKQELQAKKGIFHAAGQIRRYAQDPFVRQAMWDLARGKYRKEISSFGWRVMIRCPAILFSAHCYLLYVLGIAVLRGLYIDVRITDHRNRSRKKAHKNVMQSREADCLCSLLRRALTGEKADAQEEKLRRRSNLEAVLDLADQHKVLPFLFDVLEEHEEELTESQKIRLREKTEKTVKQSYRLLFLTKELSELFQKAGIPVIVLKGAGTASWYPVPEYRKSGDIDLLLKNPQDARRATALLSGRGYVIKSEQHANHHVACTGPEGIDIELHTMLAEPFDDEALNEKMQSFQEDCFCRMMRRQSMGISLPVAADDMQALELLLHMLQHFLRAGFGLKLLSDWVVFWNGQHPEGTVQKYLERTRECGLAGFSKAVTYVCESYLGLQPGKIYPAKTWQEFPAGYAEEFLMDIIEAQEFGGANPARMVALRERSLLGYLKEFHYQMKMNYPKESRKKRNWPILWVRTLVVFLRNNRKLHRGSLRGILKSAGDRSRVVEKMGLFEHSEGE